VIFEVRMRTSVYDGFPSLFEEVSDTILVAGAATGAAVSVFKVLSVGLSIPSLWNNLFSFNVSDS